MTQLTEYDLGGYRLQLITIGGLTSAGVNDGFETGSGMTSDPTRTLCMQKADGFYASADSCSRFFRCVNRVSFTFLCPRNLVFDRVNTVCNFADKIDQDDLKKCGYRSV